MSQDEKEIIPVSVIALRADAYSPDDNIVISLRTKFSSAERKYSVPIECFHDLIVAANSDETALRVGRRLFR